MSDAECARDRPPGGPRVADRRAELKRPSDSKTRIDTVETASVVGENSLVTITFKNCRIKRYSADGEKEEWTVEFESAKRQTLSIGAAR